MTKKMESLVALLKQHEEQLWMLQNAALQLTTEGTSPELCGNLADGLEELRKLLAEASPPKLTDLVANLVTALRVGRLDPTERNTVFALTEALVSVLQGHGESALRELLDSRRAGTIEPAVEPLPEDGELIDRVEDIDPDDVRMFAIEAREHVQRIEASLIELEATRDLNLVGEVFRAVHSIKGGAQYLGLEATATLAHRTEALLDRLRSGSLPLSQRVVTTLLQSLDALSVLTRALEQGGDAQVKVGALVAELEALITGEGAPVRPEVSPDLEGTAATSLSESIPAVAPPGEDTPLPRSEMEEGNGGPPAASGQDGVADVELFAAEYQENMLSARSLLGDMQSLVGSPEKVAVVSRNLHSLKGLAGLVGIAEIERVAGALDALVNKVFRHRRELPPDVQRAVSASLNVMDEIFKEHRIGSGVRPFADEHVMVIEELAAREGRLIEWETADPWQGLLPEQGSSALADRIGELVEAFRRRDGAKAEQVIEDLIHAAELQGCDELAAAARGLQTERKDLGSHQLRDRLLRLRDLLPVDPVARRASAPGQDEITFEAAVLAVPGVGRKKLKRLVEAGIDSKKAAKSVGLQGLIAVPGINVEQAKMLLGHCGSPGDPEPERASVGGEPGSTLEHLVLQDDYDRQLVSIYLETTVRQIDTARATLQEGAVEATRDLLGDLIGAARYMGYRYLVESFISALEALTAQPSDVGTCGTALSTVRATLERLRQRVTRLEEGLPTVGPTTDEIGELERIFAESAEGHLTRVRHDLPSFLAHMDETLLASLQHHLSCIHSAATNIGRDAVVVGAERLQSRIEEIWLNPTSLTDGIINEAVAMLHSLFEGCGLTPPEIFVPTPHAPGPIAPEVASEAELDLAVERMFATQTDHAFSPSARQPDEASANEGPRREAAPKPATKAVPEVAENSISIPETLTEEAPALEIGAAAFGSAETESSGSDANESARSLVEAQATVRVDTSKIDDLMNMVAELVVNRSAFMVLGTTVNDLMNRLIDSGQLGKVEARDLRTVLTRYDEAMTELGRVSNQLQQGVMRIRMMPVRTLFSRVPRLVRDLAMRENRQVRVVFSGEDTELDKTVIERLSDPLVHLIRNAIGHGIEAPEERVAAGKNPEGRLLISARHQGNIVIIEVEDDGRGIDFDGIRRRWAETGLGTPTQVARLSTRELLSAIFLPGFSTADKVTDVSGRGVGLDVVKRNIENVGGQVDVATEAGRYARFTIRIPLTMAIMQALLVRVASEVYAIPVSAVIQAEKITREQIYSVENQKVITIRNSVIPLVELDQVFAYNYYLETEQTSDGRESGAGNGNGSVYVVVLQGEGREVGVVVNGLVGSQDIVIKSLEDELVDGRGVAGASILGDGTVTLILDVGEIQKMVVDGQHTEEMRRSETVRRLERYIREQGLSGAERTIH